MYKVLAPLPGYGYAIGDIADVISTSDIPAFLDQKKIELTEAAKPEAKPAKKGPKS
jgi:hypothetical protein